MQLILVRHGQTIGNKLGYITGHLNDGVAVLTDTGISQAKKTGEALKNIKIDIAYSSDLTRAIDTAQFILQHHPNLTLNTTERIREISAGQYDGKPKASVPKGYILFNPNKEGETYLDVQTRIIKFMNELKNKHSNETVLVVAHGGALTSFLMHLNDEELTLENYLKHKIDNAAYTKLELDENNNFKIIEHNVINHLESIESENKSNL